MVVLTPKYSWPVPELSDPPDGVGQTSDLGLAIEETVSSETAVTWSPQWLSTGSPKPANASSITGRYSLSQGWCDFGFTVLMGGATSGGIGGWAFTLPFPGNAAVHDQVFYGLLLVPSFAWFPLQGRVDANESNLWVYAPSGGVNMVFGPARASDGGANSNIPSGPNPVQSGGRITFSGRYLVA